MAWGAFKSGELSFLAGRGGEGVQASAAAFLLRPKAGDVHVAAGPPSCLLLQQWWWLCKLFSGASGGG
jgi:hypothetical protein